MQTPSSVRQGGRAKTSWAAWLARPGVLVAPAALCSSNIPFVLPCCGPPLTGPVGVLSCTDVRGRWDGPSKDSGEPEPDDPFEAKSVPAYCAGPIVADGRTGQP